MTEPIALPASSTVEQEFAFSASDFATVRTLIYQRAGISLHEGKQAMVYSRLSRRLRETQYRSFASYLQWLQGASGPAGEAEWQEFVNCLTTNLTSFFREEHHFHALADDLKARTGGSAARIWCSASSTGEEPYSIAMTCLETLGANAGVRILASDIDTKVLATAQRGVYDAGARGLSPERLQRHFLRGKAANSGFIRVKPELARMIEFRTFNLMSRGWDICSPRPADARPPPGGARALGSGPSGPGGDAFDIIFCRNVMIYFDNPTQRQVLQQMHGVLKPGGLLYVGHSENFTDARDLFRLRGKTIYQKV